MTAVWFEDIIMANKSGNGTAKGIAHEVYDRVKNTPDEPAWMADLSAHSARNILALMLVDAVEVTAVLSAYVEKEIRKGRDMESIYADMKPCTDELQRPPDETIHQGVYRRMLHRIEEMQSRAKRAGFTAGVGHSAPHLTLTADRHLERYASWLPRPPLQPATDHGALTRKPPEATSQSDFDESLMLVGSCNAWDAEGATEQYGFISCGGGAGESALHVKVPAQGLSFQVVSATRHWKWVLYPEGKRTLQVGLRHALRARLARGQGPGPGQGPDCPSLGRDFRVKGARSPQGHAAVEVRVCLDPTGALVWLAAPGDAAEAASEADPAAGAAPEAEAAPQAAALASSGTGRWRRRAPKAGP